MEDDKIPKLSDDGVNHHAKLLDMVVTRLSTELGRPKKVGAVLAHWSIERPKPLAAVSILIPAVLEQLPRVWVFDPNDPANNIHTEVVATPEDIDRVAEIVTTKVHKRPPPRR